MQFNELFILVEGFYDKLFFDRVIKPLFQEKFGYDKITIIEYAGLSSKDRKNKLKTDNYILIADKDNNLCYTKAKEKVKIKFGQDGMKNIADKQIIIVSHEIESWYLAGLDSKSCHKFNFKNHKNTDSLTKEVAFPDKWHEFKKITCEKIINCFSLKTAINKNTSFKYFIEKYELM